MIWLAIIFFSGLSSIGLYFGKDFFNVKSESALEEVDDLSEAGLKQDFLNQTHKEKTSTTVSSKKKI